MAVIAIAVIAVVVVAVILLAQTGRRAKNLPPGPPTKPLMGNLHQIPKTSPHYQFTKWARQYGGIYSLKFGPGTAIVLTDPRLIKQLVDKKGSVYGDRPASYVGQDLITGGNHLLLMHYGEKWRLFRKLLQNQFNEARVEREHVRLVDAEATQMVYEMMMSPDNLMLHPKRFSNSIIMSLVFGIRTSNVQQPHMLELYEIMEKWSAVMETGATPPVDLLPFLKYVPESLFGMWRSRALEVGSGMNALYSKMLNRVLKRRSAGIYAGCLLDDVLDQEPTITLGRNELNFLGGVLMEGGSDTTSSMILAFVHAMCKFPHVQAKAQKEIDSVLDSSRAPRWEDYASLPYVAQVVKETMRWRPVTPLSVPHATNADDVIDGYVIPKGTIVFINVWGLHNTPRTEDEPPTEEFDPSRYDGRTKLASEYAVSADYAARDHYGYGSGRRICPGIHLAERNLFLGIVKLLWSFEFKENPLCPIDIHPKRGYTEGFLHCAKPFECDVVLRPGRRETIVKEFEAAKSVFSKYEV
ncbi:cytochrome P450 [Zopfia rhizophila CBS 207.26]|uniref:Cytochrome P450 n=1 Tax=Zopfia rhizophila CBS 207.26 TaxID=1314779 RepID=A0A6A6DTA2_9PEZI|nr:cytochrome P450 [Zopfia rhizophila CBS 207.26]